MYVSALRNYRRQVFIENVKIRLLEKLLSYMYEAWHLELLSILLINLVLNFWATINS